MQNQAQGLQRLFSAHAAKLVSVLAGPSAMSGQDFLLALAAELAGRGQRVLLVETVRGELSSKLGCRPLLPWRTSQPLDEQVISAGAYGLLYAPGCKSGDATFMSAAATSRNCDYLLFDGGRFSLREAPLVPLAQQTLVLWLGEGDAEAGYALVKALKAAQSPASILLAGDAEAANAVAQTAHQFLKHTQEQVKTGAGLYHIGNNDQETSSNTLTIGANLTWVVSRITQNDQPKVAHGGCGKGAKEV
jgi:hypothetical protein